MTHRSRLRFLLEGFEGVGVLLLVLCTWPLSKRWLRQWGSRPAERTQIRPGDELVSSDHKAYTRAIHIAAPVEDVWQWVVQFGLDRAGFYSYELLERLAGIPVKNVESIVPELQTLSVGDEIRLHPKAPGIPVAALGRGSYICFGKIHDAGSARTEPEPLRSWSIYLDTEGADSCRLLLRACIEPLRERSFRKRAALVLDEPVDFVMEQRMLRTIKRLAESSRAQHS